MNGNEITISQSIKEKLSQIEERENIRIIYACESGSRAWGFASPDSDYDVRFVFVRPVQDYLKVKEIPDFIDAELNEDYDINGWDLKKFCKQLYKSNPVIFEWADSPIVYKTSDDWEKLKAMMKDYVCQKTMIYHYLGLANSSIKKYLIGDEITYKKYFYILRALLAASWIFYNKTPAPTEFSKLVSAEIKNHSLDVEYLSNRVLSKEDFAEILNNLYEKKVLDSEKASGKRNPYLENFIDIRMAMLDCERESLEKQVFSWDRLDQLFLVIAGGNNG